MAPTDSHAEDGGAKPLIWYEEYKTCSCSFITRNKAELPGHCPRHQNPKRRRVRIPDMDYKDEDLGYAGM